MPEADSLRRTAKSQRDRKAFFMDSLCVIVASGPPVGG